MKRIVILAGREAHLDCTAVDGRIEASIAWSGEVPRTHSLQCREVEPGVYSLLAGDRAFEAHVSLGPEGWTVLVNGRQYTVEVSDPREFEALQRGRGGEGRLNVKSPMPGKVIRVLVEEGATVEEGQGLVVVEAMKMQNELKAPRTGRVIALAARAGASVAAGEILATLE